MALMEIRGLCMSYGLAEILKDISLCVEKGEVLGLIGPTGSGKTTLLRLIALLEEPEQGSMIFDSVEITAQPEKERLRMRRRMAMVFQKPVMFKASVQENISYGLKIRGRGDTLKVKDALDAVGLQGYESRDAATLSGGEMQRIALARALVLEPELLLLDEPTANLDPKSAASIDGIIRSLRDNGTAVIMATHSMLQCRRLADRVAVLVGGKLVELGSTETVFSAKALPKMHLLAEAAPW
jgi:tungstate transport system ATP-binding protein